MWWYLQESEGSWSFAVRPLGTLLCAVRSPHTLRACCRAALGKLSGAQDGQSASARWRNLGALIPVRNYIQRISCPMPHARCETLCFVVRMRSVVCLGRCILLYICSRFCCVFVLRSVTIPRGPVESGGNVQLLSSLGIASTSRRREGYSLKLGGPACCERVTGQ